MMFADRLSTRSLCFCLILHLSAYLVAAETITPVIHPIPLESHVSIPRQFEDLPLVGKCCPVNYFLVKNEFGGTMCMSADELSEAFLPLFSEFNDTGLLLPGEEREEFNAVFGDPCPDRKYMLAPEENSEDEYHLLSNGSMFAPHHDPRMLLLGVDYCMDVIPGSGVRALVCFPEVSLLGGNLEENVPEPEIIITDFRINLYASGLLVSVPFLIGTLVLYAITPKLMDVHGKALCHYCGSQALAFTSLAIAQLASTQLPDNVCICIAFIVEFSFVACFFWLNIMCMETYLAILCFAKNRERHGSCTRLNPRRRFFYFSIWAWGPPAILVFISIVMDLNPTIPMTYAKPNFGTENCWFKAHEDSIPYVYVTIGSLVVINFVLFVLMLISIYKFHQGEAEERLEVSDDSEIDDDRLFKRLKCTALMCFILYCLMLLDWTMEVISYLVDANPFDWSAFDLVNALQGILVFGIFVLRKPPRKFIWAQIQKIRGIPYGEGEVTNMGFSLLPIVSDDSSPRQTMIV